MFLDLRQFDNVRSENVKQLSNDPVSSFLFGESKRGEKTTLAIAKAVLENEGLSLISELVVHLDFSFRI